MNETTNSTSDPPQICEYRASAQSDYLLYLDGPITLAAAAVSAVGTVYAVRFLRRGHLNRRMSAALYTLCMVDFMLMMTTVLFMSVESMSMLFFGYNVFYQHQGKILALYGIRNSFAMSSTMLVCYITYTRYCVVNYPLKFASNYSRARKSIVATSKMSTVQNPTEATKFTVSFHAEMFSEFHSRSTSGKMNEFKRMIRPFAVPMILVVICFAVHSVSYFEFYLIKCWSVPFQVYSTMLHPSDMRDVYFQYKTGVTMATETLGPMLFISILSLFTEYQIHANVLARRRLFESQKRSRDTLVTEELKDKASKALAVFIVVKFLIFRSLPTFIDLYEALISESYNFPGFMTVLTRVSDFLVILNSATNTLAYFGKMRFEKCFRWLERRIRCRLLRKEAKEMLNNSLTG